MTYTKIRAYIYTSILLTAYSIIIPTYAASTTTYPKCEGLNPEFKPLLSSHRVLTAKIIKKRVGKQRVWRTLGIKLHLVPQPGDSAVLLERMARCEQQKNAQSVDNLLSIADTHIEVRDGGDSFVMYITSKKPAVAREIVRKATASNT